MKNINKFFKAFSMAEIMMVLLIMSIVLAMIMPIISKRSKIKAAKAPSGPTLTCVKAVTSYLPGSSITSDIKSLTYIPYGGTSSAVQLMLIYTTTRSSCSL